MYKFVLPQSLFIKPKSARHPFWGNWVCHQYNMKRNRDCYLHEIESWQNNCSHIVLLFVPSGDLKIGSCRRLFFLFPLLFPIWQDSWAVVRWFMSSPLDNLPASNNIKTSHTGKHQTSKHLILEKDTTSRLVLDTSLVWLRHENENNSHRHQQQIIIIWCWRCFVWWRHNRQTSSFVSSHFLRQGQWRIPLQQS